MDCQVQSGGSDCGLFSIANATALIFGKDPGRLFYDQASMRQHLFKCLESKRMLPFPTKRARRAGCQRCLKGKSGLNVPNVTYGTTQKAV